MGSCQRSGPLGLLGLLGMLGWLARLAIGTHMLFTHLKLRPCAPCSVQRSALNRLMLAPDGSFSSATGGTGPFIPAKARLSSRECATKFHSCVTTSIAGCLFGK